MAAYQAADWIREAVQSALDQTQPPVEVIVVDDGSSDDLESALGELAERVKLIRREHGGEGAAKDTGSRAAAGDFVAFLDADDVYEPRRLEALGWLAVQRPDLDILLTDAYLERDGVISGRCYREAMAFEIADQRAEILEDNFLLGHLAIRRGRLLAAGGFAPEMLAVADWDVWIRAILDGARAGLVDAPLSRYRLRDNSVSGDRARLTRWKARALSRALERPDLTAEEGRRVTRRVAALRREAALIDAEYRLMAGRPAVGRLARIAGDRANPAPVRRRAALAALSPALARRLLVARERHGRSRLARAAAPSAPVGPLVRPGAWAAGVALADALHRGAGTVVASLARRTALPLGIALMYHRVGDPPGDRETDIVPALGTSRFRAHLAHLGRHYRAVHASALPAAVMSRSAGERIPVAITFDDDLRSHLAFAAPILRESGMTATFFLCGASLEQPASFWWERLQAAVDGGRVAVEELVQATAEWQEPLQPTRPGIRGVAAAIESVSPAGRRRVEDLLQARLDGMPPAGGLDAAEARALADLGFEIGFHTMRHERLTALDDTDLARALDDGRDALAVAVGTTATSLAYPHGAADERVASFARDAGWAVGYTGRPQAVGASPHPLLIGRVDAAPLATGELALAVARALVAATPPVRWLRRVRRRAVPG